MLQKGTAIHNPSAACTETACNCKQQGQAYIRKSPFDPIHNVQLLPIDPSPPKPCREAHRHLGEFRTLAQRLHGGLGMPHLNPLATQVPDVDEPVLVAARQDTRERVYGESQEPYGAVLEIELLHATPKIMGVHCLGREGRCAR